MIDVWNMTAISYESLLFLLEPLISEMKHLDKKIVSKTIIFGRIYERNFRIRFPLHSAQEYFSYYQNFLLCDFTVV